MKEKGRNHVLFNARTADAENYKNQKFTCDGRVHDVADFKSSAFYDVSSDL